MQHIKAYMIKGQNQQTPTQVFLFVMQLLKCYNLLGERD